MGVRTGRKNSTRTTLTLLAHELCSRVLTLLASKEHSVSCNSISPSKLKLQEIMQTAPMFFRTLQEIHPRKKLVRAENCLRINRPRSYFPVPIPRQFPARPPRNYFPVRAETVSPSAAQTTTPPSPSPDSFPVRRANNYFPVPIPRQFPRPRATTSPSARRCFPLPRKQPLPRPRRHSHSPVRADIATPPSDTDIATPPSAQI